MILIKYVYPNNLCKKTILWLWNPKTIIILGIMSLISLIILVHYNSITYLVICFIYAILTIQIHDMSISDFLILACRFFVTQPQIYYWNKGK